MIDLRSDTVTRPTAEMRQAMANAELGDDVYGEDPTVLALEQRTARILGLEAAVFVPSGTMANQLAVMAATSSGDEVWVSARSHVVIDEGGGLAVLSRTQTRMFSSDDATLSVDLVRGAVRDPSDVHVAPPRLVLVENTVGATGGCVLPLPQLQELAEFCRGHGLHVHVDGARLWNAAVASGQPPHELVADVDSVAVCFSKGLGAPVGSAVAGSAAMMRRVRRWRKLLGGGMRQAGVIAAGALHALDHHLDRLADDHRRARRLAEGVADLPGVTVDVERTETNMVLVDVGAGAAEATAWAIQDAGVACFALNDRDVRFVTHIDVDDRDIDRAITVIRRVLA